MLETFTKTKMPENNFYTSYQERMAGRKQEAQNNQCCDLLKKIRFSLIRTALEIGAQKALAKILDEDIASVIERALCVDPDTPEWISAIRYSVEIMEEQG